MSRQAVQHEPPSKAAPSQPSAVRIILRYTTAQRIGSPAAAIRGACEAAEKCYFAEFPPPYLAEGGQVQPVLGGAHSLGAFSARSIS